MHMNLFTRVLAIGFISGLAVVPAAAQHSGGDAAAQLDAKRMEIRHHTEAMQKIQDPALLQSETQKHFLMTEELLGLMMERQSQAMASAGAQPQAQPTMGGGMMMEGEDAMEMGMPSAPPAGGMSPGAPQPQAGAPMGGGMMGGMMEGEDAMEMGAMGAATADPSATMAAPATTQRIAEREALLHAITAHSTYLATITDPALRARETINHQQMLDRLVELMR